ncbi:DUF4350 domain-containing protein [Flavobacterium sp. F372]|uniref:DUF4350 domain-containing protein n=1 Tax=Flavobacterium bernardetii TaxID=2813823 RepID=A0ABR7IUW7_9FLAO|nr:DUF4350 domain-containing protein [Flavobacterium bernardetii]MBC5833579.1 DUF4350 domain-containing protein [Flavobacterium bernardetii]NHF68812.1 DUF4350 domain-containing protein [Flavobacterium bernardetii]
MGKNIKILIFFLVLVLVLIIFADSNKKKPLNWRQTYGLNDKIPFGLKVFNDESEGLFKNQNLEKFSETPYEFFYGTNSSVSDSNYYEENVPPVVVDTIDDQFADTITYENESDTVSYNNVSDTLSFDTISVDNSSYEENVIQSVEVRDNKNGTIFAISDFYKFDERSTEELLYYVERGNTVFISSTTMPDILKDSLNFEVMLRNHIETKLKSTLVNSNINFEFDKGASDYYFSKFDKNTTTILGNIHDEKYTLPNFVEIKHGEGKFVLHLQPIAFTNYYLLKNNYKYIETVCSHIDSETIYWSVEGSQESSISDSPLRFIFSQPALKWAWYLGLFGIIIFMLFNAKRRQRIIPITEPVKNTTVEFAKTIGNLYFLEKNHKDIAEKKIVYFLEKIRKEYYLETTVLDETFMNRLHQKTSKDKTDIVKAINKINHIKNSSSLTEKDLVELNTLIEKLNL